MNDAIMSAFLAVRERKSADAVITDPQLNEDFINECRQLGLKEPATLLNLALLNLRKSGDLAGIKSDRTIIPNQAEFRFASEVAVRFLELREKTSLDRILCNPALAREFDQHAQEIAPGYSSFSYRWAALSLRKARALRPELIARVVPIEGIKREKITDLDVATLPRRQGVYLFYDQQGLLYVGECRNLRKRIAKHLEHSDNKGLAHWLWVHGAKDLHLEYQVLQEDTSSRVRKALEAHLIASRKPKFNISGSLPSEDVPD
jgi:site-specific DNA-methyltransferase (adenine-specific)